MAFVRSFFMREEFGIPDSKIREWLTEAEKSGTLNVTTQFIPAYGAQGPKLTVIATVVDEPLQIPDIEEPKSNGPTPRPSGW
jgi:hypothetical protein